MPSPVTPAQFCDAIPTPNSDLCVRLSKFFNVVDLLCDFFTWFLKTDGSISENVTTELSAALRPPGEIALSASTSMGTGWLLCDGSQVSRTTYSALFLAIGTRYGIGDGSTTFTLPDFRGRSPIGAGLGTQGGTLTNRDISLKYVGEESHTQTIAEMAAHTHVFDNTDNARVLTRVDANRVGSINQTGSLDYAYATSPDTTGGGSPFNVVHPCFIGYWFVRT